MKVPHARLSADALRGVIEEYVSREGTDYGAEFSLDAKIAQVRRSLERGETHIIFDPVTETVNIVTTEQLRHVEALEQDDDD